MAEHALLAPSSAERWLNCTPSVRMEEQFPDTAGQAAAEGSLAHKLAELLLKKELGIIRKFEFEKQLAVITADKLYEKAMMDYVEDYVLFVMERLADAQAHTKDALIFLEQKLDLTEYLPDGFGTSDVVLIADTVMDVIDLKYGKGVPVDAEENKQMMLYALGALLEFGYLYDIRTVRMTIHQPRLDSVSCWEIPADELLGWAESELRPRAKEAYDGVGDFKAGSHCRFCRAKGICKANAEFNLGIEKYELREATTLTDEEVSDILDRAKNFQVWLNGVQDHALDQAVNHGKNWPGYKVVYGRSNRKYSDEDAVAKILLGNGYTEDKIYEKSVLGIGKLEKEIGKAEFNKLLSPFVFKPTGKPTLTPLSDKRAEVNSAESAKIAFED